MSCRNNVGYKWAERTVRNSGEVRNWATLPNQRKYKRSVDYLNTLNNFKFTFLLILRRMQVQGIWEVGDYKLISGNTSSQGAASCQGWEFIKMKEALTCALKNKSRK